MSVKDLVIGLDIGTSSIKLGVFNLSKNSMELDLNQSTQSVRMMCKNILWNEQNVDEIVELVNSMFERIPDEVMRRVKGIQLCGQMHGVVLWNSSTGRHSTLVTWQGLISKINFLLFSK